MSKTFHTRMPMHLGTSFVLALASVSVSYTASASETGALPQQGPVRIIVPVAAGGVADTSSRNLASELSKILDRPVIVENKPGGLFSIGVRALQAAPADGLTLLYLYNSLASVQVVQKQFDLTRDLLPLTQTTVMPMMMLVSGNSPFHSVKDLVEYGRRNPGKLNYSSLGVGSTEHLKAVQFGKIAGLAAANVPYKSGPDMMTDLIAGRVDFTMTAATFASMYVPKGHVRALAVIDDTRMSAMPDVPTIAEAGINVPSLVFWGGYAVRPETPKAAAEAMRQAVAKAAVASKVKESLASFSIYPQVSRDSASFRQLIKDDLVWMQEAAGGLDMTAN